MKCFRYSVLLCVLFASCEEDQQATGFTTSSGVFNEGDGIVTVDIDIGKNGTSDITIYYVVGGSAFLNGDYRILTPTSINSATYTAHPKSGSSKVELSFQLLDDTHVEPENESIYIQITGSSDTGLNSTLKNVQYVLEIEDNDTAPSEGLQVDLSWHTGDGVTINAANLDLYLAHNVQLNSSGQLTSYDLINDPKSINDSGFESFIINGDVRDEVYYVIIRFVGGTSGADVFLHMSHGTQYGTASGRVNTNYIGKDVYYGPISKSGNNFSFR